MGPTDALPLIARVPVQPPDAVQPVAPLLDHVSVDEPFAATDLGLAVNVTEIGDCWTLTAAVRETLPPVPVHASV